MLAANPDTAWALRLNYAGRYEAELTALVDRGTGNGGSRLQDIYFTLDALGEPGRLFHPMCGTGRWASALRERGATSLYFGLDISEQSITLARSRVLAATTFKVGDVLDHWPQEAREADTAIWTFEALNYFPPKIAASLIRRIADMPRIQRVLIDLAWPFPSAALGLRARVARAHPVGAGFGVQICCRRPVRGPQTGLTDTIAVLSRSGPRVIHSTLWQHTPDFFGSILSRSRFVEVQRIVTPSQTTLLIHERRAS